MFIFQIDDEMEEMIDRLPPELTSRYPDVVEDLRNGVIEEVPDRVIDQLPPSVVDRIPESLLASDINTTFVFVLVAVAAFALLGFFWGVTRAAMKAVLFFLVVGAIAGFLLYGQF